MRTVAILALFLASAPALANSQPPEVETGTNIPGKTTSQPVATTGRPGKRVETTEVATSDAALAGARAMAGCAVTKRPAHVEALLSAKDRASLEVAAGALSKTLGKCAIAGAEKNTSKIRFSFGGTTYHGLLSEAWLIRKGIKRIDPATYDPALPTLDWLAGSESDAVMLRLANCLAHREPARVEYLVRSSPLSAQEVEGFAGIQPALAGCLDSSIILSVTKTKLRLALATAIFRRAIDPVGQPAGASH